MASRFEPKSLLDVPRLSPRFFALSAWEDRNALYAWAERRLAERARLDAEGRAA
ncbi:hypothetical protein [Streptomyces sp. NPDC087437]|uniref:hypothetical protein n=1 Tax=Streptomyces sp. NPDC087437 TaxID=3365789 RepID=UPI00382EC9F4